MTQQCASMLSDRVEDNAYHQFETLDAPIESPAEAVLNSATHHGASDASMNNPNVLPSTSPSSSSATPSDPSGCRRPTTGGTVGSVPFRSNTIAPSPPPARPSSPPSTILPELCIERPSLFQPSPYANCTTPSTCGMSNTRHGAGSNTLHLQTDVHSAVAFATPVASLPHLDPPSCNAAASATPATSVSSSYIRPSTLVLQHKASSSSLMPISRTPSLKAAGAHGFGPASAASSTVPSPILSAMGDVTPLPSPLLSSDSPGPWKKLGPLPPREIPPPQVSGSTESAFVTSNGESLSAAMVHQAKRKAYAELLAGHNGEHDRGEGYFQASQAQPSLQLPHTRNRSLSEYIPDPMQMPRRMITVSASHVKPTGSPDHVEASYEAHMRREPHLSEVRGLTPVEKPPTPPPSESHLNDGVSSSDLKLSPGKKGYEYFEAHGRDDQKRRRWRAIRLLGQGTFSRVMLATGQISSPSDDSVDNLSPGSTDPESELRYDRRSLVAVKVCEHGPKGGASEDRVEMSLKRELEIMRCIHHPSLVHLKAWSIEPSRAILVLSYCPGGDLFDVASTHRNLLTPALLARIFAELVAAVQYLHSRHIVHRDIKLENVLVNLSPSELADTSTDWRTYPYSVTTLTDLGLSRRVTNDEKLETRCGSDDYAAPEVIMGQPYDGRATDAWSLGVLLYALLEGRLPFDPNPGMSDAHRMRSRTSHRIARVEWRWIEYAGDEGNHEGDASKFQAKGLLGAMEIAEGLLKRARSRWPMDKVAENGWVRGAVTVDGGLRFREEEEGEEIC